METLAVGCAAGFSGDRVDAGAPVVRTLIERGGPAALIFENLAERTLATQQLARRANPQAGYEPLLELELRPVLADCLKHGITIVGNFGAANPDGAALLIQRLAAELGLAAPRIAVVKGDDLSDAKGRAIVKQHLGSGFDEARFVCANAYQGAFEIAQAIKAGAQVVVTGRVADPSLTLGPAMAHFGWAHDNWDAMAGATMAGHLLECGAQVSGGYFADPGKKDVTGLDDVGFPIAEISADGSCVITKASNTGGLVDERTVKEQLLYELHDPAAYITPDVVADITQAIVKQLGPDRVQLSGVRGHARTATLKANVFFDGGWFGEGEISYAGPNAEARARLAKDIMQKRMGPLLPLRFDLIGVSSVLGDDGNRMLGAAPVGQLTDIRLRVAGQHLDLAVIDRLLREVTALWTGGPAGGGGVRVAKRQRLSTQSCLIARTHVPASFSFA
ncbi:MAG: acyclic terpene utilization AtuA family protein [Pseudomonadota bacterium]